METCKYFIQQLALLLIKLYQYTIGPMLGSPCRFHPTCSEYAIDAITCRGVLMGGLLILGRLLRCHPWHQGGYDPVPKKNCKKR